MKDPKLYLIHMMECINRIEKYMAIGRDAFEGDTRTQDAVVRNFEIMGEAAKRVPESLRAKVPSVPWKRIAGLRDVLIHQYEGVDWLEIWRITVEDLPAIKKEIEKLLD